MSFREDDLADKTSRIKIVDGGRVKLGGGSPKSEKSAPTEKRAWHERRKSEPAPRARRDSDPPPAAPREESPPPPTPDQPAVNLAETIPPEIMEKVKTWKVKQAAITQGKGKVTAKTHPFKPPASLQEALDFLKAQRVQNCMLVFTNSSALSFAEGQYLDFDDFSEDDDE